MLHYIYPFPNLTANCAVATPIYLYKTAERSKYSQIYYILSNISRQIPSLFLRYLELLPVTLSAARGLARRTQRSFAALRMTARALLKSAHGRHSLQISDFS